MTTSRRAGRFVRTALHLSACLLLAGLSSATWALGLGELELDSALNERFDGRIELFDTAGLEGTEIRVSLASAEDFERVGVERFFFLTSLKFEVADVRGRPAIRVSSTQPISEPYLNFLVEVLWPSGRLLKEFTVLLDPPTFTQAAAPDVTAPAQEPLASDGTGTIERGQVNVPAPRARAPRSAPSGAAPASGRKGDGTYGTTDRSDTLWQIASETLPASDVTVAQNMLALKRKNPEAFIGDNINLLKAGYVLRTPTAPEARSLSPEAAEAQVNRENDAWRTGRVLPQTQVAAADTQQPALKAQVDATSESATSKPGGAQADGQLRIVAEAGDSAQGGIETDGNGSAAAAEEIDRLSRELAAVTAERDRERELVSDQLAVRDRQLEVKDQELAQLQAELEEVRQTMQELAASRAQNQSVSKPAPEVWWQSPLVLGGAAGALVLLSVIGLILARRRRAAQEEAFYEAQAEAAELAVEARAEPSLAPEPAFAEELPDEDRTAELEDDLAASDWAQPAEEVAEVATGEALDEDADAFASFGEDPTDGDADAASGELEGGQISDVIGESEIYIAYGRYPQAVNLLTGALAQDPDRHDVRCKLLELYAETNDRDSFESEYEALAERCYDPDVLTTANDLRGRLEEDEAVALEDLDPEPDVAAVDPADDLDGLSLEDVDEPAYGVDDDTTGDATQEFAGLDDAAPMTDEPDPFAEPPVAEAADDFELELDGLDAGVDDAADGLDLDLDLDLDDTPFAGGEETSDSGTPDATAAESGEGGAGDQLGGDLGLDFDPERDVATGTFDAVDESALSAPEQTGSDDAGDLDLEALLGDDASDAATDFEAEDEFDFADPEDGTSTKLDLAKAYIDMGDEDGARDILNEVLSEGSESQQRQAQELLETI